MKKKDTGASAKERFLMSEDSFTMPDCESCKHANMIDRTNPRCPAFPDGIPLKYKFGWERHRIKDPKQKGDIVYEAK